MRTAQADARSTWHGHFRRGHGPPQRRVRGTVQGVGFRPAVCRFATTLSLSGFVRNDADGVDIEIEGRRAAIARFVTELSSVAPAVARIDSVETRPVAPRGELEFRIVPSAGAGAETGAAPHALIPADLAPCARCLAELRPCCLDPTPSRRAARPRDPSAAGRLVARAARPQSHRARYLLAVAGATGRARVLWAWIPVQRLLQ